MDTSTLNSFLQQQRNAVQAPRAVVDAFSAQSLGIAAPEEQAAPIQPATVAVPVAKASAAEPAPVYGYERHEQQRRAVEDYVGQTWNNFSRATQGMPAEERNSHMKTVEKILESKFSKEALKSFEDTRVYQNAADEAKQLREKNKPMLQVGSQLMKIQNLINSGDPEAASEIAKMGTMKAINSLVSPDAVSIGEAMLRYPQLLNAAQINVLTNSGIFNLKGVLVKSLDKFSKTELDNFTDAVQNILSESFKTDPSQFVKIASHIYNSVAEPYNQAIDDIEQRTSARHAYELGARKVKLLGEKVDEQPAAQPVAIPSSISYPSGAPIQLGTSQSLPATLQTLPQAGAMSVPAATQAPVKNKVYSNTMFRVINP